MWLHWGDSSLLLGLDLSFSQTGTLLQIQPGNLSALGLGVGQALVLELIILCIFFLAVIPLPLGNGFVFCGPKWMIMRVDRQRGE